MKRRLLEELKKLAFFEDSRRRTRRIAVFTHLEKNSGIWINGYELLDPAIGGSEGLRRTRELRQSGFPIECRKNPDSRNSSWQYRLVVDEDDGVAVVFSCQLCKGLTLVAASTEGLSEHLRHIKICTYCMDKAKQGQGICVTDVGDLTFG
jgi:hypothetical protein